jgi:hypothetical protein
MAELKFDVDLDLRSYDQIGGKEWNGARFNCLDYSK